MRKITEIYEEYKIMPHLQMHQLMVAAVAKQVCESLDIEVEEEIIIKACLLHDMGNVIKFDLAQTKSVFGLSDLEIENIKEVKQEFIEKYGENEHEATTEIVRELGLSERIVQLVSNNRFRNMCIDKDGDDWLQKILHYADLRVGPHSIVSYDERMSDFMERYKNHKNLVEGEERLKLIDCGKEIKKQIFSHSNIKPEDINDESVRGIIEELKNFEI